MVGVVTGEAPLAVDIVNRRYGHGSVEAQGGVLGDVLEHSAYLDTHAGVLLDEEHLPHGLVYASEFLGHGPGDEGSVPFPQNHRGVWTGEDGTGEYLEIVGVDSQNAVLGGQLAVVLSVDIAH